MANETVDCRILVIRKRIGVERLCKSFEFCIIVTVKCSLLYGIDSSPFRFH